MTHGSKEQPGGGVEGMRKSKDKAGAKPSERGKPKSSMMNTMGMGHSDKNMGSSGAMGKNQDTGDGGSSDFDTGPHSPP